MVNALIIHPWYTHMVKTHSKHPIPSLYKGRQLTSSSVSLFHIRGEASGLLITEKPCWTAAQDRKGLTLVVIACNMKLSFLVSFLYIDINASSAVCVMLQCFPALIIFKFKPVSCFILILALCMKRILFFMNGLIET
jgi:hypothetical protein